MCVGGGVFRAFINTDLLSAERRENESVMDESELRLQIQTPVDSDEQ